MKIYRPEIELETPALTWWTDNDDDLKFIIAPEAECAISFEFNFAQAKQIYAKLGEYLARGNN